MKSKYFIIILLAIVFNFQFINAETCSPTVSIINQDPYPAIPGEYVKLVFQIDGLENPECGTMTFELLEQYPFIFDSDTNPEITIDAGFYKRNFNSFLIAPYKIRVDQAALKGENPIETRIQYANSQGGISNQFDIYIEDSKADFELHIDKYSYASKELTIEILNIADSDIEALTLEIPKQNNIQIKGTNRVVIGDLDSNEYTTADFKADIENGEIKIKILYTDQTGSRRETTESIVFDSSYFTGIEDTKKIPTIYFVIVIVIISLVVWWILRKRRNKKEKMRKRKLAMARL